MKYKDNFVALAGKNFSYLLTGIVLIYLGFLLSLGYYFQIKVKSSDVKQLPAVLITPEAIVPAPEESRFNLAEAKLKVEKQKQRAEAKRQAEIQSKVDRTLAYLNKRRSPVANETIARIIVEEAEANSADFRVILAIMTIESSACSQSFWYNCFGYLNGVRYSSYEQAFRDIVPKVSRQYAARYGWDFESLSRAYGQHNWQHHSKNMRAVANSI